MQRWATWAIAALAVAAIVGGLILSGGPGRGRMERRDATRMDDLTRLSTHISCLAGDSGRMPASLEETAGCPGPVRLADPFTDAAYRIEPLEDGKFRLCAGFELPADDAGRWQRRSGDCVVFDLPPERRSAD
ncbi:hypothetical protein KTN05_09085 [Paracoccus sp. Z118]|uniref:hypothetical protein n=1 Tax=Paracoccus sp. Z118 TaxID=2851017 RepID=UPI001C2BDEFF|nr:hypothetical protein [Paracoccus sp. Z118]MBV0892003.1 hypothetical protein [Paracoccus sp. Z118]